MSALRPRLSRRIAGGAIAAGLLLAACGGDDDAGTGSASSGDDAGPAVTEGGAGGPGSGDGAGAGAGTGAGAGAGEEGAYPRTVEHHLGSTEIPAAPERIVSLGYTEQDAIVALGGRPIAVRYAFGPEDDLYFPWADEAAGDADYEILPRDTVNAEQVAALEPDLIMAVTAGLTEAEYDTLSQIAPVVVQPEGFADFSTPWDEQTRITGEALAQEELAEQLIGEVEAGFDEARAANPGLDGLSLTLSGPSFDGQYPFHASGDARTQVFTDLGLVVPEEQDDIAGDLFYGALSREQADVMDTDVLVWQSGSDAERAEIEADPILAALPVVADGRALFVEGDDYAALQFTSVLSLPFLLDSFVPELVAATG